MGDLSGFSWVTEDSVAGLAWPQANALQELSDLGIESLVSLTERVPPGAQDFIHLHCPLPDFVLIDPLDLNRAVAFLIHAPRPVAVHCQGGKGRTGVVLACLRAARTESADEAVRWVRKQRPGSIDHEDLEASVHAFAQGSRYGSAPFNLAPASPHDLVVHGAERPHDVGEFGAFARRQGIQRVVSLTERVPRGLGDGFEALIHAPIRDFTVPSPKSLRAALNAFADAEAAGQRVVAHCGAGLGRTGIMLSAWLRTRHGLSAGEAVETIRAHARHYGAAREPLEASGARELLKGLDPA